MLSFLDLFLWFIKMQFLHRISNLYDHLSMSCERTLQEKGKEPVSQACESDIILLAYDALPSWVEIISSESQEYN
jgi:hypothetical protein